MLFNQKFNIDLFQQAFQKLNINQRAILKIKIYQYSTIQMRFSEVIYGKSFPEWSRCYYDYETCKRIIALGKQGWLIIRKIKDKEQSIMDRQMRTQLELGQRGQLVNDTLDSIHMLVKQANINFFKYHYINKTVVFLFFQMKVHQLNYRLNFYQQWSPFVDQTEQVYLKLLQNVFQESKMLLSMCQINLQACKKIQKKHTKCFESYKLDSPPADNLRITRTIKQLYSYFDRLETVYLMKRQVYPKNCRDQHTQLMQQNPTHVSIASFLFGMTNGISISLLVVAIILFSQNNISVYTNIGFKRDFPVWRSVSYIIFYMWTASICSYFFEKYRVNFPLVMDLPKKSISSSYLLSYSSFFTFIFMTFFVVYVMELAKIITIEPLFTTNYFPLVVWGVILFWFILPLPILSHQTRWTIFKRVILTSISPIYGSPIYTIWIIEQLISMIQPFQDFLYTICYYTTLDLQTAIYPNSCQQNLQVGELFAIALFTYRFFQCVHNLWKKQSWFGQPEMFIAIRSICNIVLLAVSYLSLYDQTVIVAWYVFVGPVIIFSYFVDAKYDWGLLHFGAKNYLLRDSLIYNKFFYYFILIINLPLRSIWIITLCSRVVQTWQWETSYFFYIIGGIQLIRRLFWNILKMENLHIENVQAFRVKTDYDQKQKIVKSQVIQQGTKLSDAQKFEIKRQQNEIENLKAHLQIKKQARESICALIQESFKKLSDIDKKIQQNLN